MVVVDVDRNHGTRIARTLWSYLFMSIDPCGVVLLCASSILDRSPQAQRSTLLSGLVDINNRTSYVYYMLYTLIPVRHKISSIL